MYQKGTQVKFGKWRHSDERGTKKQKLSEKIAPDINI